MNWKIKNVSNQAVRFVVSTASSHSKGIKLQPGHVVICMPRQTPSMDAQFRRRLLEIDKNFNNEHYGLVMGESYEDSTLEEIKLKKAQDDATDYIANQ